MVNDIGGMDAPAEARPLSWLHPTILFLSIGAYDDAVNELSRLPRIVCNIPATSVDFEISFSCSRLVGKTHLRITILGERIN